MATSSTPEALQKGVNVRLHKVFRTGEGTSSLPPPPMFVNAMDFVLIGSNILMDGGVVSPEALQKRKPDEQTIECQVLFRVAMSVETMMDMRKTIDALVKGMEKAGQHVPVEDAATLHNAKE